MPGGFGMVEGEGQDDDGQEAEDPVVGQVELVGQEGALVGGD